MQWWWNREAIMVIRWRWQRYKQQEEETHSIDTFFPHSNVFLCLKSFTVSGLWHTQVQMRQSTQPKDKIWRMSGRIEETPSEHDVDDGDDDGDDDYHVSWVDFDYTPLAMLLFFLR